ncbi:MAG TPA: SDR family NAD(P)-dependent oxidoreductase [Steroidobacteraceae bacterium]|jgi:NAD(P)-dependent dehydrogenase (short-subunit alcohol dehydrogenase family)|nr:SDR family NAD(P)-dependent oxidoreductase [Steroidobacteraceae bacterium]
MKLSGKVLVVTGSSGALGQAVATTLSGYGARVALLDHSHSPPLVPPAGALHYGGVDLTEETAARSAMAQVAKEAGRLDGLINVAGGFRWEKLEGGTLDSWDAMYRLNLRTAVVACQAALPHLLQAGGGRIVNVGAMGALKAAAGMGAYAASKAGVVQLTEALAAELKDRRITVNAILPSTLDTPQNRRDMPQADFSRWVTPAEAAEVIAFLVSDEARAVTGALIPVAGRV